jgi:hypothetical protein
MTTATSNCPETQPCEHILRAWIALKAFGVTFESDEGCWLRCAADERYCEEHDIEVYLRANQYPFTSSRNCADAVLAFASGIGDCLPGGGDIREMDVEIIHKLAGDPL